MQLPIVSTAAAKISRTRLVDWSRAQQLAATIAAARFAPLPVLAETLLLPFLHGRPEWDVAGALLATHFVLAVGIAAAAWRWSRSKTPLADAGDLDASVFVLALASGLAWAALPAVLLPMATGDLRWVLVALTFGGVALVPLLGARSAIKLALLVPVFAGTATAATRTESVADWIVPALLLGLICAVVLADRRHRRILMEAAAAQLAAGERDAVLGLLPQDDPNATGVWFWQTDEDLRLRHVSALLSAIAGWAEGRLEGKPVAKLFRGPVAAVAASTTTDKVLSAMAARAAIRNEDVEHRTDTGKSVWWRVSGTPLLDPTGTFVGYRGVGWDVTALHDAANRIAHLASHDALTDLQASEAFRATVARECQVAAADGSRRAVLLLNLDGFKAVNSSFGHAGGDELLKVVAKRLVDAAPRRAVVARLGADEFAILYAPSYASSAEAFARTLIAAIRGSFEIDGVPVSIDASIGIAVTPDHALGADALLRSADLALVRAKANGKGRSQVFVPEFEYARAVRRELETDIKIALARGEFAMHYQPLFDLAEGRIVGFEALIRWTSPTRGSVSPANFIPVAEAAGLVIEIGRFVLVDACKAAAGWQEDVRVAVNISPKHLRSPDFMADVSHALKLSGLAPTRLEIEITEGVFLENDSDAVANLHALRDRGIRIALDDFGTGYSSLNYLTNFPVDKIKIDRSFITDLMVRHENRAIVDALLTLARKLGMTVTAEGVETAEQALTLKIRRCDQIQGYLVSKAMPAADVNAMFAAIPAALRSEVPALFESSLAAVVAMRRQPAAA